ncbi:ppdK [Symbiodinium sp. CCMP2592]|nr:ppdK [Symbiodinium sp. CCMP2592]
MAMKMRHRLHNLEFKRPTSVPESLSVAGVESEPQPARAPKTYSVMYIVGTDNLAGLKTIFNHPLSILLLACPLGVLPARLAQGCTTIRAATLPRTSSTADCLIRMLCRRLLRSLAINQQLQAFFERESSL